MVQKKACDACHRSKNQCNSSNAMTPCNWCEHRGLACTFNRVRGRKKKPKPKGNSTSDQSLSKRLERIEDALAQAITLQQGVDTSISSVISKVSTPASTTPAPPANAHAATRGSISLREEFDAYESPHLPQVPSPPGGYTTSISFGQIHYGGRHLGQISQHNGMPILSEEGQKWVSLRTGDDVSFRKFHPLGAQQRLILPTISASNFRSSPGELYELPDQKIVEQVLDLFLHSAFRLVFPVVDRVLFEDTIALAYQPFDEVPSLGSVSAKCCVYAFLSIMCLFQGKVGDLPDVDSDSCAVKAHYLLAHVLEDTSVVSLQAVFMLHIHQAFSGRLQSAAMLHAIACRIVFMLGGHIHSPIKYYNAAATHEERESRQLRMLFWLCYIFDKDIALLTGQPPFMSDDYCDLTLPSDYMNCYFYLPELEENLSSTFFTHETLTPHLPGDPRLSHLKDKASRLLYSAQAVKKSDAELLRDIRELDGELENWRLSIPPDFRPALSINQNSRVFLPEMKLPRSMRHIRLHLEYHHLMTTIHRASGRCFSSNPETSSDEKEWNGGVQSSMALSLEASRSTLICLRAAVHGLAGEAFSVIVFYPMSAVMTLFFNILLCPLDPQAKLDLELLSSAADLIRSMPVRRLTPHEIGHMKMVNDFVGELIRLGNCAITKETREQDWREREAQTMGVK